MSDLIGHCPTCKTTIREGHPYAWCSECGKPLPPEMQTRLGLVRTPAPVEPPPRLVGPEVAFRIFSSATQSWQELFGEAAAFASRVGRGRLINISHSEDDNEGVVTVWYWTA